MELQCRFSFISMAKVMSGPAGKLTAASMDIWVKGTTSSQLNQEAMETLEALMTRTMSLGTLV
jgi:hypothetical protein